MPSRSGPPCDPAPVAARRVRRPRIGRRALLFVGLLVAAAAVAATVGMLRVYPPPAPPAGPEREGISSSAVLPPPLVYVNEASRRHLAEAGGDLDRVALQWRDRLSRGGVEAATTEDLAAWGDQVLVLPHIYCLSEGERATIARRVEAGGGILACGPCGVRDAAGAWIGWEAMGALIGSTEVEEVPRDRAFFLTIGWAAPVGLEQIAGRRIAVRPADRQWGVRGLAPAAFWTDYRRQAIPEGEEPLLCAGARVAGRGRVAWIGGPPDLDAADEEGRRLAAALLDGLLAFAGGAPLAGVERWPGGKRAAVLIEIDAEAEFGNVRLFDEILFARSLPGSFFCVSDLAKADPGLVRSLAGRHAIGSHSDDHGVFAGQPARRQRERLERTRRDLADLAGRDPLGLRPPEEAYDEATLEGMRATGFRYLLGKLDDPGVLPRAVRSASGPEAPALYVVPRAVRDDFEHVVRMGRSNEEIVPAMLEDLELVRRTGGVGLFSFHTHLLGRPDRIDALARFLDAIPIDDLHVVDSDRLISWWEAREGVDATLAVAGGAAYELRLRNRGPGPVEGAALLLQLPGNPAGIVLDEPGARAFGPDERGAIRLAIDRLEPGRVRTIRVAAAGPLAAMR